MDTKSETRVSLIVALHQQDHHIEIAESLEISLCVVALGVSLEISPSELIKVTDVDYGEVLRTPPHTTAGEFQTALNIIDELEMRDRIAHVMQTQEKQ